MFVIIEMERINRISKLLLFVFISNILRMRMFSFQFPYVVGLVNKQPSS